MTLEHEHRNLEPVMDWILNELAADPAQPFNLEPLHKKAVNAKELSGTGFSEQDFHFCGVALLEKKFAYAVKQGDFNFDPRKNPDFACKITGEGYLFARNGGFTGVRRQAEKAERINFWYMVITSSIAFVSAVAAAVATFKDPCK